MIRPATAAITTLAPAACATTQLDAAWTNPAYSARSLRATPVLVACEAQ